MSIRLLLKENYQSITPAIDDNVARIIMRNRIDKRIIYIQDKRAPSKVKQGVMYFLPPEAQFKVELIDVIYLDDEITPGLITDSDQLMDGYAINFADYQAVAIDVGGKFTREAIDHFTSWCNAKGFDMVLHSHCCQMN